MLWQNHIISDEGVLVGKPVIKGTRISVDHIIGLFAQGWTEQQILDNYPRLTKDDLIAVFGWLQYVMQDELIAYSFKKSA